MTLLSKRTNGWQAKDIFEFQGRRKLEIWTYKINGHLISLASVNKYTSDGCYSHAFGFSNGGDYSERVIVTSERGTEKAVKAQHARAVSDHLTAVLERATAHYVRFPVRSDDL